ncbi:29102_t:CDS:1, partial [Racocetra persica]
EYLNSRHEKDKQRKYEKRVLESDEQKDKRKQQNASNMHKKYALETAEEYLSQCQKSSAQKKQTRLDQCNQTESINIEQLSAVD